MLITKQLNLVQIDSRSIVELYSAFENYENGEGCMLTFNSLVNMLLPYDGSAAARLAHKKHNPSLNQDNIRLLREVFLELFRARGVLSESKQLFKDKDIDFHKIFETIDL